MTREPELGDFAFNDEPEVSSMNPNTKTIEADVDGIKSLGQAAESVVKSAGQALATRTEQASAPATFTQREMTPMEMVGRALEMGVSADILKQMMDLRDREEARQAKIAFSQALAAAKAELKPILKTREVDYTPQGKSRVNYRHEDLAGIEGQVGPILTKHGLSYTYESDNGVDKPITITCVLEHTGGHSTRTPLSAGADTSGGKNSLQAIASAVTYLQRYTLKLALGLSVSHDDDGRKSDEISGGQITDEQRDTLLRMIEETGTDIERFCAYFKIEGVPELAASQFDRAVKSLEKKAKAA